MDKYKNICDYYNLCNNINQHKNQIVLQIYYLQSTTHLCNHNNKNNFF